MAEQTLSIDAVDELLTDPGVQRALRSILVIALEKGLDVAQEVMQQTAEEMESVRHAADRINTEANRS